MLKSVLGALLGVLLLSSSCQLMESKKQRRKADNGPDKVGEVEAAAPKTPGNLSCDVIIVGGTTAALGAAISSAEEFTIEGANRRVCLVEPTDWPGGQLTASGVSAVDFPHHKGTFQGKTLEVNKMGTTIANMPHVFAGWMQALAPASQGRLILSNNPGQCWVSTRCYVPKTMVGLIRGTLRKYESNGTLQVLYRAVPKQVTKQEDRIVSLQVIQRTPRGDEDEERLSQVVADWYDPKESARFTKQTITLASGNASSLPVVIDASEWGELLVLARASYMQGVESDERSPEATNSSCGQAIVYPLAIEISKGPAATPTWAEGMDSTHPEYFSLDDNGKFQWQDVWAYRRILVDPAQSSTAQRIKFGVAGAAIGDISMQNWTRGNDYPFSYFLLSPVEAQRQLSDWRGGIDIATLNGAENHAIGWYKYLRSQAPEAFRENLVPSSVLGTKYGIAKVPYIRDTRRSIGVGNFVMKYEGEIHQGVVYPDSIGVGAYVPDIHALHASQCAMPQHVQGVVKDTAPFTLSLRAHTNRDVQNLLVAGKTMAQTFLANATTRLHPIEFSSGTGAGVVAAYMRQRKLNSSALLSSSKDIATIRSRIETRHGPVEWRELRTISPSAKPVSPAQEAGPRETTPSLN